MDARAYVYLAVSGESVRGGPGVVEIREEEGNAKWTLLSEIEVKDLRQGVQKMMDEDDGEHYFFLYHADSNVHVLKHKRTDARNAAASGALLPGAVEQKQD